MPEEVGFLTENLTSVKISKFGDLEIYSGELLINQGKKVYVSIAWSGWGKVSAARATTRLLGMTYRNLPIEIIFFTGVAGAVDKKLKQWDIVISDALIQHDMNASPLFEKYVIPAINEKRILANKNILEKVFYSLEKKLIQDKGFGSLYKGLIATGDMFISDSRKIKELSEEIDGLLAVEMEGGAFAQVAKQENFDWIVIRVISDGADECAHDEFSQFLEKYKLKSFILIRYFLCALLDL